MIASASATSPPPGLPGFRAQQLWRCQGWGRALQRPGPPSTLSTLRGRPPTHPSRVDLPPWRPSHAPPRMQAWPWAEGAVVFPRAPWPCPLPLLLPPVPCCARWQVQSYYSIQLSYVNGKQGLHVLHTQPCHRPHDANMPSPAWGGGSSPLRKCAYQASFSAHVPPLHAGTVGPCFSMGIAQGAPEHAWQKQRSSWAPSPGLADRNPSGTAAIRQIYGRL